MATVIFYEKPGCIANTRQKKLLEASGHNLELHNLLTHPWTVETLRPFFGNRPVVEWFNQSAPAIKAGDIVPAALNEDEALAAMVAQPLLIRRPLMQVGDQRDVGFDQAKVADWIGLADTDTDVRDVCPRTETA